MKNHEAAAAYLRRTGRDGSVVGALELVRQPLRLRRRVAAGGTDRIVFHSIDWRRETSPQLPELMSLLLLDIPVQLADDTGAAAVDLRSSRRLMAPGRSLAEAMSGSGRGLAEYSRARRLRRKAPVTARRGPRRETVLAIWLGAPGLEVGGSVTHVSGILSGFRAHGYRVTLLTGGPPPPQFAGAVDDVQIVDAGPRGARLTGDLARLTVNRGVRLLGDRVAAREKPAFVYQRHRPMLAAGFEVAERAGVPYVLEWNSSEVWTRRNWAEPTPVGAAFERVLADMEGVVLRVSDLVVAVSGEARQMALEGGAPAERVMVVPNASDVTEIERHTKGVHAPGGTDPLIGWIGSFGPWHGAEVLIHALARLPDGYRLRMVGDGSRRTACERLASDLGVTERIQFRGQLAHGAAVRELAGCDILASPHVPLPGRPFFGSPTKLFEYMALGRPIVASRLDQIGEMLVDGETARLVAPGDEVELAAALSDVWNLPDRGSGLGRRALAEARGRHTWDRRAGDVLERLGAG
jgi:glycosyltransferase involved in cell wall biosynthesis